MGGTFPALGSSLYHHHHTGDTVHVEGSAVSRKMMSAGKPSIDCCLWSQYSALTYGLSHSPNDEID